MEIGKSFSYVFDDKDWVKKVLIGGVLNIIPIVNFIPAGYGLRTLKNVADRKDKPLPEWDDFGGDFVKGLLVVLAALIYTIPIFVIQLISVAISFVLGNGGNSSDASGAASVCLLGISCLATLWGIVEGVVLPAAMIKFGTTGQFGSFFRFGEIFALIRDNLGNYIVAILLTVGAAIVASVVGGILCGIGIFFTEFWATLVAMHLFGQLAQGAAPAAAAPSAGTFTYGDLTAPDVAPKPDDQKPSDQA
jgi:hypothetical protein